MMKIRTHRSQVGRVTYEMATIAGHTLVKIRRVLFPFQSSVVQYLLDKLERIFHRIAHIFYENLESCKTPLER